jgi:hypothetical protein
MAEVLILSDAMIHTESVPCLAMYVIVLLILKAITMKTVGQLGILLGPIPLARISSTASMMVQKELGQMVKNAGMTAKSIQQKES